MPRFPLQAATGVMPLTLQRGRSPMRTVGEYHRQTDRETLGDAIDQHLFSEEVSAGGANTQAGNRVVVRRQGEHGPPPGSGPVPHRRKAAASGCMIQFPLLSRHVRKRGSPQHRTAERSAYRRQSASHRPSRQAYRHDEGDEEANEAVIDVLMGGGGRASSASSVRLPFSVRLVDTSEYILNWGARDESSPSRPLAITITGEYEEVAVHNAASMPWASGCVAARETRLATENEEEEDGAAAAATVSHRYTNEDEQMGGAADDDDGAAAAGLHRKNTEALRLIPAQHVGPQLQQPNLNYACSGVDMRITIQSLLCQRLPGALEDYVVDALSRWVNHEVADMPDVPPLPFWMAAFAHAPAVHAAVVTHATRLLRKMGRADASAVIPWPLWVPPLRDAVAIMLAVHRAAISHMDAVGSTASCAASVKADENQFGSKFLNFSDVISGSVAQQHVMHIVWNALPDDLQAHSWCAVSSMKRYQAASSLVSVDVRHSAPVHDTAMCVYHTNSNHGAMHAGGVPFSVAPHPGVFDLVHMLAFSAMDTRASSHRSYAAVLCEDVHTLHTQSPACSPDVPPLRYYYATDLACMLEGGNAGLPPLRHSIYLFTRNLVSLRMLWLYEQKSAHSSNPTRLSVTTSYTAVIALKWLILERLGLEQRHGHGACTGYHSNGKEDVCLTEAMHTVAELLGVLPALFDHFLQPQEVSSVMQRALSKLRDIDVGSGWSIASNAPALTEKGEVRMAAFRWFFASVCWAALNSSYHGDADELWREHLLPFFAVHLRAWWWGGTTSDETSGGGDGVDLAAGARRTLMSIASAYCLQALHALHGVRHTLHAQALRKKKKGGSNTSPAASTAYTADAGSTLSATASAFGGGGPHKEAQTWSSIVLPAWTTAVAGVIHRSHVRAVRHTLLSLLHLVTAPSDGGADAEQNAAERHRYLCQALPWANDQSIGIILGDDYDEEDEDEGHWETPCSLRERSGQSASTAVSFSSASSSADAT